MFLLFCVSSAGELKKLWTFLMKFYGGASVTGNNWVDVGGDVEHNAHTATSISNLTTAAWRHCMTFVDLKKLSTSTPSHFSGGSWSGPRNNSSMDFFPSGHGELSEFCSLSCLGGALQSPIASSWILICHTTKQRWPNVSRDTQMSVLSANDGTQLHFVRTFGPVRVSKNVP